MSQLWRTLQLLRFICRVMQPFIDLSSLTNPNHNWRSTLDEESVQTPAYELNQGVTHELDPQLEEILNYYEERMRLQQPILPEASNFENEQGNSVSQFDSDSCTERLRQYLNCLQSKTHDNSISYWNEFVSEYYAPEAKKRWCFSKYELHTDGIFSPKSEGTWCCEICGLKSGKGVEACLETFARIHQVKYESGMIDEMLRLDSPRARRVSGGIALEYMDVNQETVYQTFRVIHKGKLRIVFAKDLKISSWEFCIESHVEYLNRRFFAPQVMMLEKAAEKCLDMHNRASSTFQDFRHVCNVFGMAGAQLVDNMNLPLLNDLGFPKRFFRCLQTAEIMDCMKDLMTFSHNTRMGPIESLRKYTEGINGHNNTKGKQPMEEPMYAQIFQDRATGSGSNSGPSFFNPNH